MAQSREDGYRIVDSILFRLITPTLLVIIGFLIKGKLDSLDATIAAAMAQGNSNRDSITVIRKDLTSHTDWGKERWLEITRDKARDSARVERILAALEKIAKR